MARLLRTPPFPHTILRPDVGWHVRSIVIRTRSLAAATCAERDSEKRGYLEQMTRLRRENTALDHRFQKVATDFWFAVQRLGRRREGPPPGASDVYPPADDGPDADGGDDGPTAARVPRRPSPSSGSASAAVSSENKGQELL